MNSPLKPSFKAREIEFYIEELVLEGISPMERYAIHDALSRELEHLLNERGDALFSLLPEAGARDEALALGDLSAGSISLKTDAAPEQIGKRVAKAVFGSLHSSFRNQQLEQPDSNLDEA